jgi:L-amino acid N-acyltransferase YncA
MKIVQCTYDRHATQILEIFNEVIASSTALFDYKPRTIESMAAWFEAKENGNFPVIGAEYDSGQLIGFASFGTFRAWPAYKYTVEHSVYVHKGHRGRGLGRTLMTEAIKAARQQDYHVLVGCIESNNSGSIALHESLGFTHAGTLREAGFKFGRWLDVAVYQLILPTPTQPRDE